MVNPAPVNGNLYGFTGGSIVLVTSGSTVIGTAATDQMFHTFGSQGFAYVIIQKTITLSVRNAGFYTFPQGVFRDVVGWTGTFDNFAAWSGPSAALVDDPATGATLVGGQQNASLPTTLATWQQNAVTVLPPSTARFIIPTITIPGLGANPAYVDSFNLQVVPKADIVGTTAGKTIYPWTSPRALQVHVNATRTNLSILPRGTAQTAGSTVPVSAQFHTSGPITVSVDVTRVWNNVPSAKIVVATGAISYTENATFLVVPGEYLTYSGLFWADAALTGNYAPKIIFRDANGAQIVQPNPATVISTRTPGTWTPYSVTVQVPANAVRAQAYPLVTNLAPTGTDTFWLTGLLLEQSATVNPWFDGAGSGSSHPTDYVWDASTPGNGLYGFSYYYPNRVQRGSIIQRTMLNSMPVDTRVLQPIYGSNASAL